LASTLFPQLDTDAIAHFGFAPFLDVHPGDAAQLATALRSLQAGEVNAISLLYRIRGAGRTLRWLQFTAEAEPPHTEREIWGHWVCRTHQWRTERLLELQTAIIDGISSGRDLASILTDLTLGLERLYDGVWISIMRADHSRGCLNPLAEGTLPPDFSQHLAGLPIGPQFGACGAAAATRQRVIVPDIAVDERFTLYRSLLDAHQVRAIWSEPILAADGQLLGTFAVYRTEVHEPSLDEKQLIESGSRLAALAWQHWDQLQALRDREDRFRSLAEQAHMIPWEADIGTNRYTYVGPQAESLGYPLADWLKPHFWQEKIHPEDCARTLQLAAEGVAGAPYYEMEYRLIAADGNPVWMQDLVQVVRENGVPLRLRGYLLNISDRKTAEAAQRKSQAFLDAALASLPFRLWATKLNGDIILQNPVSRREFGDVCGKNTWELPISPEFLQEFRPLFEEAARGNDAMGELHHQIWGEDRYERFIMSPVRVDGEIVAVLGCDINLTNLRVIQEQLLESESRIRTITSSAPDLILQVGRDLRIRYINHMAPELTMGDVLGSLALDWVPAESRAMVQQKVDRVFAEGVSESYEVPGPSGTSKADHWYEVRVSPVLVNREVASCIMIARDVTEERKARVALQESELRYRLVAENSADMIIRVAADGTVLYSSPNARTVFKRTEEETLGRNAFTNILPEDLPQLRADFARLVAGEPRLLMTFRARAGDGQIVWVEASAAPIHHPLTGKVTEVLTVARDITSRIESENRSRRHQADLAHVERLSALGQMASELAHELNQPLAAIANYAQACLTRLQKDGDAALPAALEWLERIDRQARRAGEIIRRVSQFVRKGELDRTCFDLNECIRSLTFLFELALHGSRTRIEFDLTVASLPIYADRLLIEQVLLNLVRNAGDAMDETPPAQRIVLVRSEILPGGRALLQVSDNGPGISPEHIPRLFEPYFTTKIDGTGLGLAICKSTIEAHGGAVSARNEPSGGASLLCELPLVQHAEE
jgi:PAS domain S-box-containing protein